MVVTIGGIPVFDAVITDEGTGMFKISLVDDPAIMNNFQAFDAHRKMMMYAIENEEKRLVRGCIMRCDFPIYRRDSNGEYYVIYKKEEIRKMAEKYLAESRQNDVNTMHEEGSDVEGVHMVQYFIKGDGVSVEGFDDCNDGSLFGEFHVVNDAVWEEIKSGTYKGFSLEGVFDLVPEEDKEKTEEIVSVLDGAFKKQYNNISKKTMSKLTRLKERLAKVLQEFGNITTDKGIISWDGDEDLKVGDPVFIEDEEGNNVKAEDGDYKTDDNKVIVVADGKVAEIKDAEVEVVENPVEETPDPIDEDEKKKAKCEEETPVETPVAETPSEEDKDAKIAELEEKVKALEEENAKLKEEIASATEEVEKMKKMSLAKSAHEEVETSVQFTKTGNRGIDNLARILSAK